MFSLYKTNYNFLVCLVWTFTEMFYIKYITINMLGSHFKGKVVR